MNAPAGTEETTGLCPTCLRSVAARIVTEGGRVWLVPRCPRHGESRAVIASDPQTYWRLRTFVPDRSAGGCCGPDSVCDPQSGPPTCVLLLEITDACNLRCPTCYADARGHDFLSVDTVRARLDAFFRTQGRLDVLMLSGGEPTIHPQFEAVLALALRYPIDRVLVNTNGLRLTQRPALVETLAARRDRVELYFSYASHRSAVHERLYGKDLVAAKRAALASAAAAGILTTLVPTVERGVNDDEVGDLYRFALSLENVNGITYQPVMDTGRYENAYDPGARMTLTDVLTALEEQTGGALRPTDFVGLPCSHPDCCALTYGLLDAARTALNPLTRHLDVSRYLDLFADRISFSGLVGAAARRVWSDVASPRAAQTVRDLALLFSRGGVRDLLPLRSDRQALGRRLFRVVVKPFMDPPTYDRRRIESCCTKLLDENGAAVSFCEYNVFRRGRTPRTGAVPLTMAR